MNRPIKYNSAGQIEPEDDKGLLQAGDSLWMERREPHWHYQHVAVVDYVAGEISGGMARMTDLRTYQTEWPMR